MSDQARLIERGLLTISSEPHTAAHLVTASGELDGFNARELEDELIRLERDGCSQVVLNLGRLELIDSTGLAVIVKAHRRMEKMDYSLIVVRPQGQQARRAFELSGLDKTLSFVY
jgi:anti-anti-sigma factor